MWDIKSFQDIPHLKRKSISIDYQGSSLSNQYYRYLKRQMVPTQTTKILQCRCKNLVLRKFDDIYSEDMIKGCILHVTLKLKPPSLK